MKNPVIYPGTFDPITNGHLNMIIRATKIFPKVIVAVASNELKKPFFSLSERVKLIQDAVEHLSSVSVVGFDNLLVDFAKKHCATVVLRGVRASSDFEYERQFASINRHLSRDIETIFLTPEEQVMFISSSMIKEIVRLNGDISPFVPANVINAFNK